MPQVRPRRVESAGGDSIALNALQWGFGCVCAVVLSSCAILSSSPGGRESEGEDLLRSGLTLQSGECSPCPCLKVSVVGPGGVPAGTSNGARREIQQALVDALLTPLEATEIDAGKDQQLSTDEKRERFTSQLEVAFGQIQREGVTSAPIDWRIDRVASLLYSNGQIATYEVVNRGYLGGAHGFDDRKIFTFNLTSGKRLALADIIEEGSRATFDVIIEREFRRVRQISPEKSLLDEGLFLSESGGLALTDNIGIVATGLVLHYNPYEVAPYSYGPTHVIIPREALVGIVTPAAMNLIH